MKNQHCGAGERRGEQGEVATNRPAGGAEKREEGQIREVTHSEGMRAGSHTATI